MTNVFTQTGSDNLNIQIVSTETVSLHRGIKKLQTIKKKVRDDKGGHKITHQGKGTEP